MTDEVLITWVTGTITQYSALVSADDLPRPGNELTARLREMEDSAWVVGRETSRLYQYNPVDTSSSV